MKKEDFEKNLELLSLDEFEEDEFMLNTPSSEKKDFFDTALDLFKEDNVVDTTSEQDFITGIEYDEDKKEKNSIDLDFLNKEILDLEQPIVLPANVDSEAKKETIIQQNNKDIIDEKIQDVILDVPNNYNALENIKPKRVLRRNREEREAYIKSTLKEIKKIKDEIIVELKLKKLSAEVNISFNELKRRLDELPVPRKRKVINNYNEVMAEEKKPEVIETDLKKELPKAEEKKPINEKDKKKRKKQMIFCIISVIFILGCIIFFGSRMIKYYKIYNPKAENGKKVDLLSTTITANEKIVTEGSGLYKVGSNYEFKGENVNNYLIFNNQLFRVLRINQDGSVDAVLSNSITNIMWNNKYDSYDKSDIYDYLNNEYIKKLDKELLTNINYCNDAVDELSKITCDKNNTESFVRLLGITDYLNAKVDSKSFIGEEDIWLYNVSKDKIWHTNGGNLSTSDSTEMYYVKPVIRLKNSVPLVNGKGTSAEPYTVSKNKNIPYLGSNVKLGNDNWVTINTDNDFVYLAKKENIDTTYRFDLKDNNFNPQNQSSAAEYLNNTFYNSLSYKDVIQEATYYTGNYINTYKEITKSNVKAHVGMISLLDNTNSLSDGSYYLMTGLDNGYVYYYNNGTLMKSKVTLSRGIKPVIAIKGNILKSGTGSSNDPYVMGD